MWMIRSISVLLFCACSAWCSLFGLIENTREFKFTAAGSVFPVDSVHGYIPVNNNGDDIFYWFFPSKNSPQNDPIVVWFTGGPGCSSEFAILFENGPFNVTEDGLGTVINPYSWNSQANLLYVDQPIGTGFSHGKIDDIPTLESQVKVLMQTFFQKWIRLPGFAFLQGKPMFITGESYGGHYVPSISNALFSLNDPFIKIAGVAIGNGLVTTSSQYKAYANFSSMPENSPYTGFTVEDAERLYPILEICEKMIKTSSVSVYDRSLNYCQNLAMQTIKKPNINEYDITMVCQTPQCFNFTRYPKFMNRPEVLNELGVDMPWKACSTLVNQIMMRFDWNLDYAPELIPLLNNNIRVLAYYGMNDWICNWVGGLQWTLDLKWARQAEWQAAGFTQYYDIGNLKSLGDNLLQFLKIPNCGHMVPTDLPQQALEMLNMFIRNQTVPTKSRI